MIAFAPTPCLMRSGAVSTPISLPWPTHRVSLFVVDGDYVGEAVYLRVGGTIYGTSPYTVDYEFARTEA